MKTTARAVRLFFTSQSFADGLRITMAVLLPALFALLFGQLETGVLFSLGALAVSITDTPGAIVNRTNTMLYALAFNLLTALVTVYARQNIFAMGVEVLVFSFFFSMFLVYGARGGAVGSAALLVMVLTMDREPPPQGPVGQILFVLVGGIWYTLISLLLYHLRPFRTAERTLGECVLEISKFLHIKASFYDCTKDLETSYRSMVHQQMVVSEKQDAVREILFKTRQIVKDASVTGRKLLLAFTDTVDLFEEATATFYDYRMLRQNFSSDGVLEKIGTVAHAMADEIAAIGMAIHTRRRFYPKMDSGQAMQQLRKAIEEAYPTNEHNNIVLRKLLVNIRRMLLRMEDLQLYFVNDKPTRPGNQLALDRFVSHQSLKPQLLFSNLNGKSSVFRFSLRVAIAALVGFILSKFITAGQHSYWIVMTILFMLKPSFGLTRQRNIERIGGTLAGGVIGIVLLYLTQDKTLLFAVMVLFILGTFSFFRTRYLLAISFVTPFLLIFFHFLGMSVLQVLGERILDTLLGCVVALTAGYLLFPAWEGEQLMQHLKEMLKANSNYFHYVVEMLSGKTVDAAEYKLARKDVYVSSANLSAAFQRMLTEPKRTRRNSADVQQFVVLNHILFSNIATLAATLGAQPPKQYPIELARAARKLTNTLCGALELIDTPCLQQPVVSALNAEAAAPLTNDEALIKKQLEFMQRLGTDIAKAAGRVQE